MEAAVKRPLALRARGVLVGLGLVAAAAAAVAAPSSRLLPAPTGTTEVALAAIALAVAFAIGYAAPLQSLFGLFTLAVLEGAIRKWIVNEITVFLLKDFLALGIYAAVLPRLSRAELRRPWWLTVPLLAIVVLALAHTAASDSSTQAAIGLRGYLLYVPLLWVAPALLGSARRALLFVAMLALLGIAESSLAVLQAVSGPGPLNRLVSGAIPAIITVNGVPYLRPPGTFMQVGALSLFFLFATLATFALIAVFPRGRLFVLGLVATTFLAGAVVYSSARTVLASTAMAAVALVLLLVIQRRFLSLLAVCASFGIGIAIAFQLAPYAGSISIGGGAPAAPVSAGETYPERARRYQKLGLRQFIVATLPSGKRARIEIKPSAIGEPSDSAAGAMMLRGRDNRGRRYRLDLQVDPATPTNAPGAVRFAVRDALGAPTYITIVPSTKIGLRDRPGPAIPIKARALVTQFVVPDYDERVIEVQGQPDESFTEYGVQQPSGDVAGGFLGRAADIDGGVQEMDLWGTRIEPQLDLISGLRLLGHGTGTMTLGAEYADPGHVFIVESSYAKLAWELGLPGLLAFVWLMFALVATSVRACLAVPDEWRPIALVAGGAGLLLLPLMLLSFALDVPIVPIAFFSTAGCAVWIWQRRQELSAADRRG